MAPLARIDTTNNPKPCGYCRHERDLHGCRSAGCACNGYAQPMGDASSRDPLEAAEGRAQRLARMLDAEMPKGWGFGLVLFSYGGDGYVTWISSAQRDDMAKALRELLARWDRNERPL